MDRPRREERGALERVSIVGHKTRIEQRLPILVAVQYCLFKTKTGVGPGSPFLIRTTTQAVMPEGVHEIT